MLAPPSMRMRRIAVAAALWWSWSYNGYFKEGYQWLERMLAATPEEETLTRAKMLAGAGFMAEFSGMSQDVVIKHSEASVDLFRKLGHKEDAAFPLATLARIMFFRYDLTNRGGLCFRNRYDGCLGRSFRDDRRHGLLINNRLFGLRGFL